MTSVTTDEAGLTASSKKAGADLDNLRGMCFVAAAVQTVRFMRWQRGNEVERPLGRQIWTDIKLGSDVH